jgi:formylglycine-generating enzyme required for sulfatase activity
MVGRNLFLLVLSIAVLCHEVRGGDEPSLPKEITDSMGISMVLIPAGKFVMGSSEPKEKLATRFEGATPDDFTDEYPAHTVEISKPFYLGKNEVTQEQWTRVMETTPWKGEFGIKEGANYPAIHVNWDDANEFCHKLSAKEGKQYRLPTEAEWEYACRAGTNTQFSFGDSADGKSEYGWWGKAKLNNPSIAIAASTVTRPAANVSSEPPKSAPRKVEPQPETNAVRDTETLHEVGQKKPNPWGLYDMHGNAWEWCSDNYGEDYYRSSPAQDPQGPEVGRSRTMRGGAYFNNSIFCRSALRSGVPARGHAEGIGFRVVMVPESRGGEK